MRNQVLRRYGALIIAILILLTVLFQAVNLSIDLNDGEFIYGLDDAYIHMSIATNFADHGVWGVTQYEFTSATSSPLWTGLLAFIYVVIGTHDLIPLALNLLFAILLLVVIDRILYKHAVSSLYRFIVLFALIIILPLNTLIMIGMEHVLHAFLALIFIDLATQQLTQNNFSLRSRQFMVLCVIGMMLGAIRYEGLFLVAIFCVLFVLRMRLSCAIALGGVSAIPIVIYGLIAINNGWEFLPTSLLLKNNTSMDFAQISSLHDFRLFFIDDTWNVFNGSHMLFAPIIVTLLAYLLRYERIRILWDDRLIPLIAVIAITIINIRMVSYPHAGTFARYEAYLIVLWTVFTISALSDLLPRTLQREHLVRYAIISIMIAFTTKGIWQRYIVLAYRHPVVTATENIYQQQVQMAHFLQTYYNDSTIGANDIGAISYFTDIHLVDLYGLANIEVARAKHDETYDTNTIRQIMTEESAQIAIIYETWFTDYGGLPEEWVWVGQWEVTNNVMLGYHQVTFYAVNANEAENLADNLRAYSPQLPDSVIERGIYISADLTAQ